LIDAAENARREAMTLRAIVIGTGWAGEGHSKALRAAGVEVVALCGRTPEPAQAMAQKLGIATVHLDWRVALHDLQPDLVAVATPGHLHAEMVLAAVKLGCHILCEKPLGLNAGQAQAMLQAVTVAGVKHAYCTTSRYAPAALHAQQLLASGLIGQVQEIECIHHFNLSPLTPASWFFQISQGGGALFTDFPHFLGQVLFITGGQLEAVCGAARPLIDQVPVGAPIHDFRASFAPLDPQQVAAGAWQPVDADVLAIYAEALMDLTPWNFWTPEGEPTQYTERILTTLEAALAIVPGDLDPADFSTDHTSGEPYIMWEGTPYEHLMVPVTDMEHHH